MMGFVVLDLSSINSASMTIFEEKDDEHKILQYISLNHEVNFIAKFYKLEFLVLRLVDELERKSDILISKISLVLPNNCFKIRKIAQLHDYFFDKSISDSDIFNFYKETWQYYRNECCKEEIINLSSPFLNDNISQYQEYYHNNKIKGKYIATFLNLCGIKIVEFIKTKLNLDVDFIIPYCWSSFREVDSITKLPCILIDIGYNDTTLTMIKNQEIMDYVKISSLGVKDFIEKIDKEFGLNHGKSFNLLNIYVNENCLIEEIGDEFSNIQKSRLNSILVQKMEEFLILIKEKIPQDFLQERFLNLCIDGFFANCRSLQILAKNTITQNVHLISTKKKLDIYNPYASIFSKLKKSMFEKSKSSARRGFKLYNTLKNFLTKVDDIR